jgi:uncharacterized protein YjiS (DUF1127 family)
MHCRIEPLLQRKDQFASRQTRRQQNGGTTMLISLIRMVRDYLRQRATYAEIARLDDRTLRDIGLAPHQRPFRW